MFLPKQSRGFMSMQKKAAPNAKTNDKPNDEAIISRVTGV